MIETCRPLVGADIGVLVLTPTRSTPSSVLVDESLVERVASLEREVCFHPELVGVVDGKRAPHIELRVGETCPEALAPYVEHAIVVRPKAPGTVALDVVDHERRLIKQATFEAHEAANLLVSVTHTSPPQPDGSYSLRVGSSISFSAIAKDAADVSLRAPRHSGVTFTWDDTTVVAASTSDDGERHVASALKPGTARLTIESGNVEKSFVVNTFDF